MDQRRITLASNLLTLGFFFLVLDRRLNQELNSLTFEEQTLVLLIRNLPPSELSLRKLLSEEQLFATNLHPNPNNILTGIPLPHRPPTSEPIKVSRPYWLRHCVYIFWGPVPDARSYIWHDLSPKLLRAIENKTMIVKALAFMEKKISELLTMS